MIWIMNSTWLNNLFIYTHTHTLKKQKQNKTGQKKKNKKRGFMAQRAQAIAQGKAQTFGLGFIILFFIANNMLSANPDFEHHSGGQKIRAEPLLLKQNINFKLFQPKNTSITSLEYSQINSSTQNT